LETWELRGEDKDMGQLMMSSAEVIAKAPLTKWECFFDSEESMLTEPQIIEDFPEMRQLRGFEAQGRVGSYRGNNRTHRGV
jgi:hypothetical protein